MQNQESKKPTCSTSQCIHSSGNVVTVNLSPKSEPLPIPTSFDETQVVKNSLMKVAHSYRKKKSPNAERTDVTSAYTLFNNINPNSPHKSNQTLEHKGFFSIATKKTDTPPPPKIIQDDDMIFPLEM